MDVVEVMLQHQLGVEALLPVAVALQAERAIEIVEAPGGEQGEVGVVVAVEQESMLHVAVEAVRFNKHTVGGGAEILHLSSLAVLMQIAESGMHDVVPFLVFPTVLQVQLFHRRRVVPAVAVLVHVHEILLIVRQHLRAEMVVQVHVTHHVGFALEAAVAINIDLQGGIILGLEVLHIDLAGNALGTVLDARGALANGDAFHPRPRHIAQRVGHGGTEGDGQVFEEHLHILSAETQQLDLPGAHSGIVVVHIHRRVGDETLSQVAAGGTEKLVLAYGVAVLGASEA